MFHFNFDLEDSVDETTFADPTPLLDQTQQEHIAQQTGEPFSEIDLDGLLESLPPKISYSIVSTPALTTDDPEHQLKIARRDLFDARFQLIAEEGGGANGDNDGDDDGPRSTSRSPWSDPSNMASALRFIDAPSDLVPLVYEGGLKTWECSLDLARCLKRDGYAANVRGRRVLELGCGTAIPTLCVLQELFSAPPAGDGAETHLHLQDYNASVVYLVVASNVVLAWYTSPAADAYRASIRTPSDGDDRDPSSNADSELHVTPELCQAFKTSLRDHRLRLRFFSGAWDAFDVARTGGRYDLVITSETIYRSSSLLSLVRVLRDACAATHERDDGYAHPSLSKCLVAAKTVYFGVGGGAAEFVGCIESSTDEQGKSGQVETIWETSLGVSRKVMLIRWI